MIRGPRMMLNHSGTDDDMCLRTPCPFWPSVRDRFQNRLVLSTLMSCTGELEGALTPRLNTCHN